MSLLIIYFVRLSQIWGSYLTCSSFLIANNANESKRNRSQGVCILLLWWQEQLPNQESYCDKVVGVTFASVEQWSVRKTGAVKGRNMIKTCESEGWGHECHEGNRTNSLPCLTTESDKLTHTSASLFSSLSLFSPLPSSSLSALIQLCICILNDSITWNPAVKIMDVFHYFSPLGHSDPSRAPIRAPSSFSHLSLSIHLSFFLLSHCRRRFFFLW